MFKTWSIFSSWTCKKKKKKQQIIFKNWKNKQIPKKIDDWPWLSWDNVKTNTKNKNKTTNNSQKSKYIKIQTIPRFHHFHLEKISKQQIIFNHHKYCDINVKIKTKSTNNL